MTVAPAPASASPPATVAPAPAPAPRARAAHVNPSHPLANCRLESFASGWVKGQCQGYDIFIYAGFSATASANFLRQVSEDRLDAYDSKVLRLRVAGRKVKAWELTAHQRKVVQGAFGEERRLDRNGKILSHALFAKVKTPRSGKVGVLCHASAAEYQRSTCRRAIASVSTHDVPTGALPGRKLRLAGVELRLKGKRCWAPNPQEVYCFLDGGLRWSRGSAAAARAWLEERIKSTGLAPMTRAQRQRLADGLNEKRDSILASRQIAELENTGTITTMVAPTYTADDIEQRKLTRHAGRCRIAGVERECTRVDLYGVLDSPARYQYFGFVPEDGQVTTLECSHNKNDPAPTPCREIFGSFVVAHVPRR